MTHHKTMRLTAAGALYCSAILTLIPGPTASATTFLMSDVTTWIGPAAGPDQNKAVLVIQWPGQSTGWAWGFRWSAAESKTGSDLLQALAGADPRFSFTGSGFISDLRWDADLNGAAEWSFPGYNATTGEYLNYFVNNNQQPGNYNDGAAPAGAHVMPPLGSPYDEGGPGTWVSSNTGVAGRPLADGSWDGWIYSDGAAVPLLPVNAPLPVPEPGSAMLILTSAFLTRLRRRRAAFVLR